MKTSLLYTIGHRLRQVSFLKHKSGLWRAIRPIYHRALKAWHADGTPIEVPGGVVVRVPADLAAITEWTAYEVDTARDYCGWIWQHPGTLVLDVGCAIGEFSVMALFADEAADVFAFDSDLPSLAVTRRLCSHASGTRLSIVHGLLTTSHASGQSMSEASRSTRDELDRLHGDHRPAFMNLPALGEQGYPGIPQHSLDGLLGDLQPTRPVLVKCDCEGAEQRILAGAERLLARIRPDLLLAVHPFFLPRYGDSAEALARWLDRHGYDVERRGRYYDGKEEHWWCRPRRLTPSSR